MRPGRRPRAAGGTVTAVAGLGLLVALVAAALSAGSPASRSSGPAATRPPGSPVLTDAQAAARVRVVPEQRAANVAADHTIPGAAQLAAYRAAAPQQPYTAAVTGDFKGTTDEIVQWAAWKWGIDADVMRAVATQESDLLQSSVGDGGVSFGLFSVKTPLATGHAGWPGTYPLAKLSTAFNADVYGRAFRSCYDGRETWLGGSYRPGDQWGCVGLWYSGSWHDAGAEGYVASVKRRLADRAWTQGDR